MSFNFLRAKVAPLLGAVLLGAFAAGPVHAGEAPELAKLVEEGKLPPLAERLPEKPFVVDYAAEGKQIGKYGGSMRMLMEDQKDLGQITVYEYARLVGYGPDIEMKPDILEAVDVVEDREFTLRLRKGHKWSDGHPFTAEDFRYFWEDMVKDPELGREGVPPEMLVGGEEPKFEVIDELTVKYSWSKPNTAFLPALAAPSPVYIYRPAHYMKQYHAKYADKATLEGLVQGGECRGLDRPAHAPAAPAPAGKPGPAHARSMAQRHRAAIGPVRVRTQSLFPPRRSARATSFPISTRY